MRTLSKIAALFFLGMMLIGIVKNTALYAIYDYDKTLFISMFCENKDRPQLKCNGQCKLAQMRQEQSEKEAANTLKQLQVEVGYYNLAAPCSIADNIIFAVETVKQNGYYNRLYFFLYTTRLVKPPDSSLRTFQASTGSV